MQANTTSSIPFPSSLAEFQFWRSAKVSLFRLGHRSGAGARDTVLLAADVLQLRSWRKLDPLALLMLAVYAAMIAHPLVYGNLGSSVMALMTPVK